MLKAKWDGDPETVHDHISTLQAADAKLTAMKKPVDPEILGFLLLHSLPDDPNWEIFKTSVLNSMPKDTKVSFSDIQDRLVFNATRQIGSESALKAKEAKGSKSAKKSSSSSKGKRFCSYHKATSHNTDECWTLKKRDGDEKGRDKDKRKGKQKGKEVANKSSVDDTSSESSDSESSDTSSPDVKVSKSLMARIQAYYVRTKEDEKDLNTIVLDSGASSHMSPRRDWFHPHKFKKLLPPIMVQLGDGSEVPATGTGSITVKQKLEDGEEVERTIENVLFVPSFGITLMSVRKFNKCGLYSTFTGRRCAVKQLKDDRPILEGFIKRNLYELGCIAVKYETPFAAKASTSPSTKESALHAVDINVLHRRMAHISMDRLKEMVNSGQLSNISKTSGSPKLCEPCVLGKMSKLPLNHKGQRSTHPLQIIHSDVGGPITPSDRHGHRFWITFIDDHTRFPWIYFMKQKSEAVNILKQWKRDIQKMFKVEVGSFNLSENFLTFFQSDNGGEYLSKQFQRELSALGTIHHTTAADTPEQNGIAEHMNQTLANLATTMLIDSGLNKKFWSDAMATAAYMVAHTPGANKEEPSPYSALFKRDVDATWFRPFGSTCYALVPKMHRKSKFSPKARKSILLGYTAGKKAYRLLDASSKAVFHSRHVRFDERKEAEDSGRDIVDLGGSEKGKWEATDGYFLHPLKRNVESSGSLNDDESCDSDSDSDSDDAKHLPTPHVAEPTPSVQPEPTKRKARTRKVYTIDPTSLAASRPRRGQAEGTSNTAELQSEPTADDQIGRNGDIGVEITGTETIDTTGTQAADSENRETNEDVSPDGDLSAYDDANDMYFAGIACAGPRYALHAATETPETTDEAFNGPDKEKWEAALTEELQSLADNNVYEIVPTPPNIKPITAKIVMRTKLDAKGEVERHKIRIVARGFTQKEGIDYKEVFAPVANLESVRIIIALAAKYNLELDQMDVTTAYLNGELLEELYLVPPKEVKIPKGHCWRLKRSLYGLKQAGRTWNHTLDKKLQDLKFVRLNAETCLYVHCGPKGEICFLVVYVDDLLLAATSRKFMDDIKSKLKKAFKMKDLGPASYILGLQIIRDRKKHTIALSQAQYSRTVVKRCGMDESKPAWTPMAAGLHLTIDDPTPGADNSIVHEITINGKRVSYPSVVGSLNYAVSGTRPDLAHTVSMLGRFSANPKAHHWQAVKRVLRYLNTTADMALVYDGNDVSLDMDFKADNNFRFEGYSDANWCGDNDTSKSTSGFVFTTARAAIGWASKLQSMVALSSTESEYIGLCNAGQHLAWLRTFFEDIGKKQQGPTTLYCDNQAAIILSKDAQFRARTKHINRKYHFVRDELVAKGEAVVTYVPTDDMVADILTKSLGRDKHWKFTQAMGLRLIPSGSDKGHH